MENTDQPDVPQNLNTAVNPDIAPTEEPNVGAAGILALSIVALLVCGIMGPINWRNANIALRTLKESGAPQAGQYGMTRAGQIISIIATVLWIAGFFLKAYLSTSEL